MAPPLNTKNNKEFLEQIYQLIMSYHTEVSPRPWIDIEKDIFTLIDALCKTIRHNTLELAANEVLEVEGLPFWQLTERSKIWKAWKRIRNLLNA